MKTLFNPRITLRAFGGLVLVLSVVMMIDAEGFSTRGFPNIGAEAVTIATYMHQVFGATLFAFATLMLGATLSTDAAQCARAARLTAAAFVPSLLVMTYHWTGPVPDVMAPALLNTVMWLWVLLSGFLYTPDTAS